MAKIRGNPPLLTKNNHPTNAVIQSVQRAAAILQSFTHYDSELSVTFLSERLGLHKSTVSRLLSTLQRENFVEQNPENGKYRLGLGLVTLAGIVLDQIDLRDVAQPHLRALSDLTQETINLVVLNGHECMNVGGVDSPRPIQYIGRIGRRTPLHCTAAGKVLLAFMPVESRQEVLPKKLARFTEKTITERKSLNQVLATVQAQGYAITEEEHQDGVSALAAPVFDHTGQVIAAITVSGPTYRLGLPELEQFIGPVQQAAREISTHLGFTT